jgi:hypothetical protein
MRGFTGLSADHLDLVTAVPAGPPLTISAWVQMNTLGAAQQWVNLGQTGSSNDRYSVSKQAADTVAAQEKDATTTSQATTTQTIADTTSLHLVVARFTSHSSRASVLDNNSPATNSVGPRTPLSPIQQIRVSGDLGAANRMDGYIGHIAIWDIDLIDSDIALLYTNEPRLVQPNHLIHYWPLNANQSPEPDLGLRGEPLIVSGSPTFLAKDPVLNWLQEAAVLANVYKALAG